MDSAGLDAHTVLGERASENKVEGTLFKQLEGQIIFTEQLNIPKSSPAQRYCTKLVAILHQV